jgi:hypothetical protein
MLSENFFLNKHSKELRNNAFMPVIFKTMVFGDMIGWNLITELQAVSWKMFHVQGEMVEPACSFGNILY